MTKVRTTINPTTEIDVDDAELRDLTGYGLILKTQATTDDGLANAARRQIENAGNGEKGEG